jgi:hypothetical protein
MAVTDYLTYDQLSYYYFPSWIPGIMVLLLAPLVATLGVEVAVILSSRVSDVRGANQLGGLTWIPFMVIFVAGVTGAFSFSTVNLLMVSGIVLIADVALFFLSKATFSREKILTRWK